MENKDKDDDDHVRRVRESVKRATDAGKKNVGPPDDNSKDWSCGRVFLLIS